MTDKFSPEELEAAKKYASEFISEYDDTYDSAKSNAFLAGIAYARRTQQVVSEKEIVTLAEASASKRFPNNEKDWEEGWHHETHGMGYIEGFSEACRRNAVLEEK